MEAKYCDNEYSCLEYLNEVEEYFDEPIPKKLNKIYRKAVQSD